MKNWLRQRILNYLNNSNHKPELCVSTGPDHYESRESTIRFNVTSASGGVIVQYNTYNAKRDESHVHTYVIHDDEAVTQKIAEIVTMALLRN
jgi:hypothetical protein